MKTITVHHTFKAPIERVFETMTNSAELPSLFGMGIRIAVRAPGPDADGVGALRDINAGLIRFREEITAFERPYRMDYRILEVTPHFEHLHGSFLFESVPGGTQVTWTSTIRFPGLRAAFKEALAVPVTAVSFKTVLAGLALLL